jgi:hypothetical protein
MCGPLGSGPRDQGAWLPLKSWVGVERMRYAWTDAAACLCAQTPHKFNIL